MSAFGDSGSNLTVSIVSGSGVKTPQNRRGAPVYQPPTSAAGTMLGHTSIRMAPRRIVPQHEEMQQYLLSNIQESPRPEKEEQPDPAGMPRRTSVVNGLIKSLKSAQEISMAACSKISDTADSLLFSDPAAETFSKHYFTERKLSRRPSSEAEPPRKQSSVRQRPQRRSSVLKDATFSLMESVYSDDEDEATTTHSFAARSSNALPVVDGYGMPTGSTYNVESRCNLVTRKCATVLVSPPPSLYITLKRMVLIRHILAVLAFIPTLFLRISRLALYFAIYTVKYCACMTVVFVLAHAAMAALRIVYAMNLGDEDGRYHQLMRVTAFGAGTLIWLPFYMIAYLTWSIGTAAGYYMGPPPELI
jgi:hypothetical protein